jgi:peptidyl-prolyl cis-trans isomerase C
MVVVWTSQWQRPPTPEEMRGLVESKVREEILYREALALGLDQGDTIVKRRLAQKLEFLAEDVSGVREPNAAELKAWFDLNREQFALPGRATFRHLYFSPQRRGALARDAASQALEKLAGKPVGAPAAATLGDRFMYQDYYADREPEQVASVFGSEFAQALFKLKPGSWQGPVESGLGWHLVFVESIAPGRIPALAEVQDDAKVAWTSTQREEAKRKMYDAMRARYEVVLPKTSP